MRQKLSVMALPALLCALLIVGPFTLDPVALWAGIGIGVQPGALPGAGTIDPAAGIIAYPLGFRAAWDVLHGILPLWNHFEGLGAPLLGEMQSAALFPPTLLLLLPHGPLIEHSVLQAIAGLGTYLFLRRFGLGATAAVAGAVLYEFNGVFAWIGNAIVNPVPFLPWLFYAVETLFLAARDDTPLVRRLPPICLGGLAAASALYAGFPEVVYFYSLLLFCWVCFRLLSLPRRRLVFLGDLLGLALLAALIASPLLIAFATFLPEAAVGGHAGEGYRNDYLSPAGLLAYLLPYVYGPIFAAPGDVLGNSFWFNIGGYLGVMPLLLGTAGLIGQWRRPACWLLAAWAAVAIGVSHGLPGVHDAFMLVPLAKLALYARYLNTSWIFCCIVLSAVFIDDVPRMTQQARRRFALLLTAVFAVALGGAAFAAWPQLSALWHFRHGLRLAITLSVGAAILLLLGTLLALRAGAPRWLTILAAAEAVTAFLLPFASYPHIASYDRALVRFLRDHAGLQRVAVASHTGLMPNFGAVFGFPLLNYDDLPVPARTVNEVFARLDPDANPLLFRPDGRIETPAEQQRSRAIFMQRLPAYAASGVRYLLAPSDFFAAPASASNAAAPEAAPTPVFTAATTTVFEVPRYRRYASAEGCTVSARTQDLIAAHCDQPSPLVRLEVFLGGWSARVNDAPAPIVPVDDTFQGVALPAGDSVIAFSYAPPGLRAALPVAAIALLAALAVLARAAGFRASGGRSAARRSR